MTEAENIEDFKEVTEAEKTKLQASDAAWVRAPQEFIERYNMLMILRFEGTDYVKGKYNESTGYFERYGLNGYKIHMTYEEALKVIEHPAPENWNVGLKSLWLSQTMRTHTPIQISRSNFSASGETALHGAAMEIVDLPRVAVSGNMYLNKVVSLCVSGASTFNPKDSDLVQLQFFQWSPAPTTRKSIDLKVSSKLNIWSVKNIVTQTPDGATVVTVTLHANVYKALTGEAEYPFNGGTREEWSDVFEQAQVKNITFASA